MRHLDAFDDRVRGTGLEVPERVDHGLEAFVDVLQNIEFDQHVLDPTGIDHEALDGLGLVQSNLRRPGMVDIEADYLEPAILEPGDKLSDLLGAVETVVEEGAELLVHQGGIVATLEEFEFDALDELSLTKQFITKDDLRGQMDHPVLFGDVGRLGRIDSEGMRKHEYCEFAELMGCRHGRAVSGYG